jgi:hypothetical protein
MVHYGMAEVAADALIDSDRAYWGVKGKLRKLDEWNRRYCDDVGHTFTDFVGSSLHQRWEDDLYKGRNAAVHAGASSFSYDQASRAIAVAKECISMLESRIPGLQNRIQLNTTMSNYRQSTGEVVF